MNFQSLVRCLVYGLEVTLFQQQEMFLVRRSKSMWKVKRKGIESEVNSHVKLYFNVKIKK